MVSLPLLPVEGAQGEGVNFLVVAVALLLLILCPLALARVARGAGRAGLILATGAILLTLGAVFVVHDAVSFPEVACTLAVGSGLGYLLVRHASLAALGRLVAAAMGLAGLGGLLTGTALWLDPRGLGLVKIADTLPTLVATIALGTAMGLNLLLTGAAAYLLMRQAAPGETGLAGLAGLGGGAACLLGGLLGNLPMVVGGAVVCAAVVGFRAVRAPASLP